MAINRTFTAPVADCHADGWLQQLHARAVDRLSSADYRHQLLHCRLQMADVAGWPSLELVDPLAEPTTELLNAYRAALATVLQQAAEALVAGPRPDPEPDGDGLSGLWRQVLNRMRGSRCAMAFWRARLISLDAERAVIEFPSDEWLRYSHQFLPNAEDALALVLGQRIAVVPTWPDADGGEG
jgi:hypothetical protein